MSFLVVTEHVILGIVNFVNPKQGKSIDYSNHVDVTVITFGHIFTADRDRKITKNKMK